MASREELHPQEPPGPNRGDDPSVPGERDAQWGESIDFECLGCGGCCTNTTPFVTPSDVWNLSRAIGVSTGDFLEGYLVVRPDRITAASGVVPLLCLDEPAPSLMCRFLDPSSRRCRVYLSRPLACRMFPAGVRHERSGDGRWDDRLILVDPLPECRGYGRSVNTVREYLEGTVNHRDLENSRDFAAFCEEVFAGRPDLRENEDFGDAFLAALFDLDSRPGGRFEERYEAGKRLVRSWVRGS